MSLAEKENVILKGKNITLREIEVRDAEFLFELRTDPTLNKHISQVDNNLETQIKYLEDYRNFKRTVTEYYFIMFHNETHKRLGVGRLYNINGDSFCMGSWIIKPDAPKTTAMEAVLLFYDFAFFTLGFMQSDYDVRKINTKVISFHQRMGAKIVREDELNYYFNYKKEDYEVARMKYRRFL